MAKGSIVRRTRYTCCLCGKSTLLLARTVTDPAHVICYDCATSTQPLIQIYNSVPTIPYEGDDEPIHTAEHPYCCNPTCPCQEERYSTIAQSVGVTPAQVAEIHRFAENEQRTAAQDRNQTTQCADGSWW